MLLSASGGFACLARLRAFFYSFSASGGHFEHGHRIVLFANDVVNCRGHCCTGPEIASAVARPPAAIGTIQD
jgi:hypothetical protein